MAPIKVAFSIPSEGHTPPEGLNSLLLVAFHMGLKDDTHIGVGDGRFMFHFFTTGRLHTGFARELLTKHAIENGMDYIFMIDDDMICPGNIFDKLYERIEKNPAIDIIAPLAFTRNPPHDPVIYGVHEAIEKGDPVRLPYVIKNYPKDKLLECDAVGFGAVLIKMEMVKRMKSPYFSNFVGQGEDISFCCKAKYEANARVFVDTSIKIGHLGRQPIIDEEYARTQNSCDAKLKEMGEYEKYGEAR